MTIFEDKFKNKSKILTIFTQKKFESLIFNNEVPGAVMSYLCEKIPKCVLIYDISTGKGTNLKHLSEKADFVISFENNKKFLKIAKKNSKDLENVELLFENFY
jgi:predicted RNA methylase